MEKYLALKQIHFSLKKIIFPLMNNYFALKKNDCYFPLKKNNCSLMEKYFSLKKNRFPETFVCRGVPAPWRRLATVMEVKTSRFQSNFF